MAHQALRRKFNRLFTKLWAECREGAGRMQYPGLVGVAGRYHSRSRNKETKEAVRRGPPDRGVTLD